MTSRCSIEVNPAKKSGAEKGTQTKQKQKQNRTSIRTLPPPLFLFLAHSSSLEPTINNASKNQKRISQVPVAPESMESTVSVILGK